MWTPPYLGPLCLGVVGIGNNVVGVIASNDAAGGGSSVVGASGSNVVGGSGSNDVEVSHGHRPCRAKEGKVGLREIGEWRAGGLGDHGEGELG